MSEAPEQPISDERIATAKAQIKELCDQAFQAGYAQGHAAGYGEGVKIGFEVATEEMDKRPKSKVTLQ